MQPQRDVEKRPALPAGYALLDDLISEFEAEPDGARDIADARKELASETFASEGRTVRMRRLELGYSQAKLAALVGTRQPHIARIERGTENLQISTCRRLAAALQVDMNTLDAMLEQQAALSARS